MSNLEFISPNTMFLVQSVDMGVNKFEDLCCTSLKKLKRKCTDAAAPAAKEVIVRADLLRAAQFIADSWGRVRTKTIQNSFALGVLNTQTWRCTTSEIMKGFHSSTAVFSVIM
jgi:hypothetical protein